MASSFGVCSAKKNLKGNIEERNVELMSFWITLKEGVKSVINKSNISSSYCFQVAWSEIIKVKYILNKVCTKLRGFYTY